MSLSRNFLAGLANSTLSICLNLVVVPLYLKYLGIEAYGLIGFFVTMQALMGLLDIGIVSTINREVARYFGKSNLQEAGKLVHTLAVLYWCIAGFIALLVYVLTPFIVDFWLQAKTLSPQTISHAVMLMGIVIACRWPSGLYQGVLIGAERLAISSSINMIMASITSLGTVLVLAFISSTIEAFFIWQAFAGIIYVVVMRRAAWQIIGQTKKVRFDIKKVKSIWRFSVAMSCISIVAFIVTQLDKVLLSRLLSLEDFGSYSLAVLVASVLNIISMSTFNVIYPRFSSLIAKGHIKELTYFYRTGTRLFSAVIFPIAITGSIFAKDIISLWTGNLSLASKTAPITSLLFLGHALNGIMIFPFALQLAFGKARLAFNLSLGIAVIIVPLIFYFVQIFGAIGGGLAWLLFNTIYLFFGTWVTHRYLLKGILVNWLTRDVGINFCIALIVISIGRYAMYSGTNILFNVFLAFVLTIITFLFCILFWLGPNAKRIINQKFVSKFF
jgi:O-antigen/teichoic acid export membrane protein